MVSFCILLLVMTHATLANSNSGFDSTKKTIGRELLNGRHLVIGIIDIPPYVLIQHNPLKNISHVDGFVPHIISWMAEKFEYVEPPDGAFGAFVNGSWNGLVGLVVRGKIDIVATALSVTYPRSQVVDFTFSFSDDPMALLIPFPQLESTISAIAKPFQHEVWIGIGLSFLVASVVLWVISRIQQNIHHQSLHGTTGWFTYFWFLFRAVINPNEVINFTLATRLIIAAWCLMGIVFVNSYTSSLLSYLLAPTFLPVISTVQDLADSHIVQITSLKHTSADSALFAATSGSFAKLGASLRAHPENLLETLDNIEDIVFNQRKAFPYQETSLKQRIYDDFKATRQCRLSIAKDPLFPDQIAFALPKASPLTTDYNYEYVTL
ncbi:hypothetical protein DAPPUDRAFT_319599 [Daphnia pulex]|uniref:Ionotropic glutamate receptor L-glutamate and glycine-binding domain-containing protein n=1 Tax=Daphnia pulex TaxID=6669 RepID=E9GM86_DAPPU|nr:hypothetical protein DAPPUDRAFT_319599 [Daphnia pulex]|eukprot:EFX79320.1 hypothetical protein DAPPUDRAFT_319599 [Daphnia pulex]